MTESADINIYNHDARVIDLYPDNDDMSWFGIYHKDDIGDTVEWHIKAININEAIGAFFVENEFASYCEIIDHMEIA